MPPAPRPLFREVLRAISRFAPRLSHSAPRNAPSEPPVLHLAPAPPARNRPQTRTHFQASNSAAPFQRRSLQMLVHPLQTTAANRIPATTRPQHAPHQLWSHPLQSSVPARETHQAFPDLTMPETT